MWCSLLSLAWADWPEEVSLLAMADYDGASTQSSSNNDYVAEGYARLVKELGLAVANRPITPAESLGINGFALTAGTSVALIHTGYDAAGLPLGWDLADPDEDPQPVLLIPWLNVQKGLPASLEVGATFGWIASSNTGILGVNGRWALLEGYRQVPQVAVSAGYSGYVGNDELELGVMDLGASLGYTMPFGVTKGIHQAEFSPYVGARLLRIHAAPRVDLEGTGLEDSLAEVSGMASSAVFDKAFAPLQVEGGLRLVNGDYAFTLAGAYAPGLIANLHVGLGFVY